MKKNTSAPVIIFIILIIVAVLLLWHSTLYHTTGPTGTSSSASLSTPLATINYVCMNGVAISAVYYSGSTADATPASSSSNPNQPPTPTGSVMITLPNGQIMTLDQTISADGARYASADGSFVFWSKGNSLMITQNGQPLYNGCVAVASNPGGLPQVYASSTQGFSIRYPANYTVDSDYTYENLGPGKGINGVKFTIDPAIATGTNLGSDSYISVEQIPTTQMPSASAACSANLFLDSGASGNTATSITDTGTTYSVASSTGAGAGNRYLEIVYAIPGTSPCIAVRYFIHYGVLENYPAGAVTAFNQPSLIAQFDSIRRTLMLDPQM